MLVSMLLGPNPSFPVQLLPVSRCLISNFYIFSTTKMKMIVVGPTWCVGIRLAEQVTHKWVLVL